MTEPFHPKSEGPKRSRMFARALKLNIASLANEVEMVNPSHRLIHENIPDWLTDEVASAILYTIDRWHYAKSGVDLVIYIPLHWVASMDRYQYRDAKLFGEPLRLNEYVDQPQVACNVVKRPK